jgi:hypothetical protein
MPFIITHSSIEGDGTGEKLEKLAEPQTRYCETDEERERLAKGEGTHFKLYDDDDNCYFTGKYLGDPDSEEAFEPLDWASRYAGCTYIKYRQADGTYEIL